MDYNEFCEIMKSELPLNRKERFFTGTVLPALLFHKGFNNFYEFLGAIKGLPPEICESSCGDNFIFYTEYNLKESGGDRNIGVKFEAPTNETPDVVIEILEPVKVIIVIEAKMFAKVQQHELTEQISRQKKVITDQFKKKIRGAKYYHLALVPEKLKIENTTEYQVITWEFFLDNNNLNVQDNLFYNYLRFAIENYDDLVSVSTGGGRPVTCEFYMKGSTLPEFYNDNPDFWIGRMSGEKTIINDIKSGKWRTHKYCMNSKKPSKGQPGNWIPLRRFIELLEEYDEL